ncbi:hypothetical protein DRJ17_05755 [Candidatus Woesearchaeota archaeon]|nr:MAG: hypothetical protein DRJ17_05755 [Candidatus Woesearchaeota archaeon]
MIKSKLYEATILGRKVKIGSILYSKHNGTPFRVEEIKIITINEGVFGLEETDVCFTVRNLATGKKTELTEYHMALFK